VYNVIWEDGEHSIHSADNINFLISKGVWKKLEKMADGGGVSQKNTILNLMLEKQNTLLIITMG
jgi:hypothetical protein